MPPPSLQSKIKIQLKLSVSRLRMAQHKDDALRKKERRAIATECIASNNIDKARLRVESLIQSDIQSEVHGFLELYSELLLARIQLLDPPPPLEQDRHAPKHPPCDQGIEEAVRSIIFAAPRVEIKELMTVRNLLIEKFGKDFATPASKGEGVAPRVEERLKYKTPEPDLVDKWLWAIAETYELTEKLPFDNPSPPEVNAEASAEDDDDDNPSSGGRVKKLELPIEAEDLSKATPPRDFGPKSPVRVAPPNPTSDDISPHIKLPRTPEGMPGAKKAPKPAATAPKDAGPGGRIPNVDDLAARFAALKPK